jgi:predicted phosphodiesterase
MSDVVILGDIHGNGAALEQVIQREGSHKEYFISGDIHGLLGWPVKTVELLQSLDATIIAGNHDKAIFDMGEGHVNSEPLSQYEYTHTINSLTDSHIEWMRDLEYMSTAMHSGKRICLAHAYPWPEQASGYEAGNSGIRKSDVIQIASVVAADYDYVILGHTHEQYELDCSKFGHDVKFINGGTLGYDGNYATVNFATGAVNCKQIDIDRELIQAHVQSVLPEDCPSVYQWY